LQELLHLQTIVEPTLPLPLLLPRLLLLLLLTSELSQGEAEGRHPLLKIAPPASPP